MRVVWPADVTVSELSCSDWLVVDERSLCVSCGRQMLLSVNSHAVIGSWLMRGDCVCRVAVRCYCQ